MYIYTRAVDALTDTHLIHERRVAFSRGHVVPRGSNYEDIPDGFRRVR